MQMHVQVSLPGVRPPGLEGSCFVNLPARRTVLTSAGCSRASLGSSLGLCCPVCCGQCAPPCVLHSRLTGPRPKPAGTVFEVEEMGPEPGSWAFFVG